MARNGDIHTAAHLFDPYRLTLAREFRGYTKAELAKLVDKTPATIGQLETRRSRPDPRTLARIVLALGMPAAFFIKRDHGIQVALDQCHFRSNRSATQRERRKLVAAGTMCAELADCIEKHIDNPYKPNIPSAKQAPASPDEVEALAEEVRAVWERRGGPISNMVRLLERNGVLVMRISADCRRVEAFSFWHGQRPCVFLGMDDGSASRSRFDAAHELGHLVMHEDVAPGDRLLERQADRFASAFLMPRAAMLRELPDRFRWAHFIELKQRWKVSFGALVRRARDLNRLSESSYRRACIALRNRLAEGQAEPAEPEVEHPQYILKALEALEATHGDIARHVQLTARELHQLGPIHAAELTLDRS